MNYPPSGCTSKTGTFRKTTVPVGSLPPNPWGLHEVAGNAWEWVQDVYHCVFASRDNGKNSRNGCSGIASNPSPR
ncbi:SUMF1/EgtB/PvdO family nonheme iron enzyme [uncultured Thiodictyon sp.]|uniref:SUMF1/EgtB/PvdO family nonheme iron enzyme n=1 Tax=uncultured Thiodictyon sp. TaxID=1846217 RepID=UPI0025EBA70D|nr:SUMF1/EgtB/PvdO family nonheme iron enzyme [uncultured Thiodictyon sp.]